MGKWQYLYLGTYLQAIYINWNLEPEIAWRNLISKVENLINSYFVLWGCMMTKIRFLFVFFLLKKDNPMIKLSNRNFLLFAGCYLNFLNIFTSLWQYSVFLFACWSHVVNAVLLWHVLILFVFFGYRGSDPLYGLQFHTRWKMCWDYPLRHLNLLFPLHIFHGV